MVQRVQVNRRSAPGDEGRADQVTEADGGLCPRPFPPGVNRLYLSKLGYQVASRGRIGPRVATDGARRYNSNSRVGWADGLGLAGRSRMEGWPRLDDNYSVSGTGRRRSSD